MLKIKLQMKIPGYWSVDWYFNEYFKIFILYKTKKIDYEIQNGWTQIFLLWKKKEQTVLKDFIMLHIIYNQDLSNN